MKLIPFSERKLKKWIAKDVSFYCFGAGTKLRSLCNTIEGFEKQIAHIADNNDKPPIIPSVLQSPYKKKLSSI